MYWGCFLFFLCLCSERATQMQRFRPSLQSTIRMAELTEHEHQQMRDDLEKERVSHDAICFLNLLNKRWKYKNSAHSAFLWERSLSHSSCRCSVCFCSYARRTWIWNAIRWLDPTVGGASLAPRTTRRKTMTRIVATALDVGAAARGASPTKSFKCMELFLFLFCSLNAG